MIITLTMFAFQINSVATEWILRSVWWCSSHGDTRTTL